MKAEKVMRLGVASAMPGLEANPSRLPRAGALAWWNDHQSGLGKAAVDELLHADGQVDVLIRADIHSVAVIASIASKHSPRPSSTSTPWRAETTQPSGTSLSFEPAPFTSRETVSIVVEIDRHAAGWKVRAVGQGYDTGLADTATDFGINVED